MLSDLFFQALFASCIPEIIDLIGTRPKYGGGYKNERVLNIAMSPSFTVHCTDAYLIWTEFFA